MQDLLQNTDYFSMENMRLRDVELYNAFIGENLSFKRDMKLSERLLYEYDLDRATRTQSSNFNQNDNRTMQQQCLQMKSEQEESMEMDEQEEMERLHNEFREMMQLRFLRGLDRDFNYSQVDSGNYQSSNQSFSSWAQKTYDQDMEDKYFEQ